MHEPALGCSFLCILAFVCNINGDYFESLKLVSYALYLSYDTLLLQTKDAYNLTSKRLDVNVYMYMCIHFKAGINATLTLCSCRHVTDTCNRTQTVCVVLNRLACSARHIVQEITSLCTDVAMHTSFFTIKLGEDHDTEMTASEYYLYDPRSCT